VRTAFQSLLAPPASELAAGVRGNPVDFRSGTSTQMKTPGRRYLEIASVRYPSAFSAGYQTPVDRSHAGLFRRVRLGPASWNLSDSPGSSRSAPLRSPRTTEPQLSALSGRLLFSRPQCRPADLTHYKPGIPTKTSLVMGSLISTGSCGTDLGFSTFRNKKPTNLETVNIRGRQHKRDPLFEDQPMMQIRRRTAWKCALQ
jgi:hypothetical protein